VHIQECPHRSLPCEMCAEIRKFIEIDERLLACKLIPVRYPNDCRCEDGTALYFIRRDISHHRTVCPMEEMVCMYASSGCNISLPRRNMILHENNAGAHIGRLSSAFQDAEERIRRQELDIADQKRVADAQIVYPQDSFQNVEERIRQLEAQNLGSEDQFKNLENVIQTKEETTGLLESDLEDQNSQDTMIHFDV
jgi:hypothetical protein